MSLTKIGSIGINTGIQFAGITTVSTLKVGSGVTVSSDGDVFFTGIATGNGSGLTALNASNISSGTVPTARLGSGTASSSTFLRGDSTFQTVDTNLVADTSPQLGGNLDVNTKNILFGDSSDGSSDDVLIFGAGSDLKLFHDGTNSSIQNGTGTLRLRGDSIKLNNNAASENYLVATANGAVELYYDNSKKIETSATGVNITGTTTDDGATHDGDVTFTGANGNILFDKSANALLFGDNVRIKLGAGNDAELYHDGSHTYLKDVGTGNLRLAADDTIVIQKNTGGESIAHFIPDGAVELYHNNSKKFYTESTGISVYGAGSTFLKMGSEAGGTDTVFFDTTHSSNTKPNMIFRLDADETMRLQSTGGISFNGDTAAANALDDYEEGIYSPTLTRNSSNVSYGRQKGRYIVIGHMCFAWFDIETSGNNSSGSGTWKVSLPFTFYSNTNGLDNAGHGSPSFRDMSFFTRDQGYKTSSYIDGNQIQLRYINSSNDEQNMIETGSNGRVTGQVWGYLNNAV